MYTMQQMSKMLEHMSMRKIAEDTGMPVYQLRQIKNLDGNAPYKAIKRLSEYFDEQFGAE